MTKDSFEIKKVGIEEVELLQKISRQTFIETFSEHNTENDMQKYLSENLSIAQLKEELNTSDSSFYFINNTTSIFGYLKLNLAPLNNNVEATLEIERIYILKEFQGKKYGNYLLQKAIEVGRDKKCSFVFLGVWEKNEKAISFYLKHNFKKYGSHIFKLGDDEQTDILMKLNLN
jgi:ribosomal protein S18 acetylase RimI-like enzyme